jgi:site-specific DNA recombinase
VKTAAIYARFSTDLQNDRSVADQLAHCRSFAERNGYQVIATFEDRAVSGSSMRNRPGILQMLDQARDRRFQAVIAESTSRLGRDQEDRAAIRKRLRFVGIEIVTPSDGVVTDLTDGIRAVIDSQYIDDLRAATKRGLRARISEGLSAGGRAFGYAAVPGRPGVRVIDEKEAAVVRRIFQEFLDGKTPREIAHGLNKDKIAPPRTGTTWNASTINGNGQRGCGILRNPLYAGRLVWNKVRMVKDPETAKRISQPNPPSEWLTKDVPDLAILAPGIFEAAQQMKAERGRTAPAFQRKPQHLLSGLLRCAACGGGLAVSGSSTDGRQRLRCSRHIESRSCPAPKTFYREAVEKLVLDALQGELRQPAAFPEFVREYQAERRRLARQGSTQRAKTEQRLGELRREIDRLTDAIAEGRGDPITLGTRQVAKVAELRELEAALQRLPEDQVVALHPAAVDRYLDLIARLQAVLDRPTRDPDASQALRELVETVTVHHTGHGKMEIVIIGRLNALLGNQAFPNLQMVGSAVAGTRYRRSHHFRPLRFELRKAA